MKALLVCTLNTARSVTAERLYHGTSGMQVRSAGIFERVAHRLDEDDLVWADRVVVVEDSHVRRIRDTCAGDQPAILDAGVPDECTAHVPAVIAALRETLDPVLGPPGRR